MAKYLFFCLVAFGLAPSANAAEIKVCNNNAEEEWISYHSYGNAIFFERYIVEGWWKIEPDDCMSFPGGPTRTFYMNKKYEVDESSTQGSLIKGPKLLCFPDEYFFWQDQYLDKQYLPEGGVCTNTEYNMYEGSFTGRVGVNSNDQNILVTLKGDAIKIDYRW